MIKTVRFHRVYLLALFGAALLSGVLGAFALRYNYDFRLGVYETGVFSVAAPIVAAMGALAAILYPLIRFRGQNPDAAYHISPLNDFAALFAFSAIALSLVYSLIVYGYQGTVIYRIKLILTLPAALFFLTLFLLRRMESKVVTLLCGLCIVWMTFSGFYAYFDPRFTMVSPHYTIPQLAVTSTLLLLVFESRVALERGGFRSLLFSASLCGVLSVSIGVSYLLAYLLNFNRDGLTPVDALVFLSMGLYGFARALCLSPVPKKNPTTEESSLS